MTRERDVLRELCEAIEGFDERYCFTAQPLASALAQARALLDTPEEGPKMLKFGDECRAACTAPARYLDDGLCVWVSAQNNDIMVSPTDGNGPQTANGLPLVSDEALEAAMAMHRHRARLKA
jgi:hypothetical protein